MNTNPVTLIVGTGAAVLIARTFYDSLNTARGHESTVSKKDSKTKKLSKTPSATTSKMGEIKNADNETSVPAIDIECTRELADNPFKVDQKLNELANEANAECIVARPDTSTEMPRSLMVEVIPVEDQEAAKHEKESGSASTVNRSLDGFALKKTSGVVNITDDVIQLHTRSYQSDDSTKTPSKVHVSVDIMRKPESGVHVSVDVMQKADASRQAEHVDCMSQSNTKQLENSTHLWERFDHVAENSIGHLESAVYAKDQVEQVQEKDAQRAEINVHGASENGLENLKQSERHSRESAMRASSGAADLGAPISEPLAPVYHGLEDGMELTASGQDRAASAVILHSEYENVLKQPESERDPTSVARSEQSDEDPTNRTEFSDHESGYSTADNAQSDEENETSNPLRMTSSDIDQEIRRSIALESLKRAIEQPSPAGVDDLRPETPTSQLSTQQIYSAIQALCVLYNTQLKYNKDAKNYLVQIQSINCSHVDGIRLGSANDLSGALSQEKFLNEPKDSVEEVDNIVQLIENMNEYAVDGDQDEDVERKSAASDSIVDESEQPADDDEDEAHGAEPDKEAQDVSAGEAQDESAEEAQDPSAEDDESNVEKESNTTTGTLTNSLVIYVKHRSDNDISESESGGFDALNSMNEFEVVSCTPNIFQNVIVRRVPEE